MSTHGAANATSMGPSPPGPAGGRPGKGDPAAAARRKVRDALNHQAAEEVWFAVVASFIFVLTFIRFIDLLAQWYRRKQITARIEKLQESKEVDALPASSTSGRVALRRIPLALLAAFRAVAFRTTIPVGSGSTVTVADGLTIAAYYAAILTFDFVRTSMGASGPQRFYYMDRAAFIGAAQIPLVVALAGKNNVVSWLTGISHEKLNVIHRAGGRILTMLFWLHGISRTKNGLTFVKGLETTWMKAGVLALTALTLTFIIGLRPIRRRFFEFFLISHIITVTLFIAGGYVHRPDVKYYFWPGFLVWGLDRTIRVGRVVWFNFRLWRSGDKISTAHVELVADNTVRITAFRPMNWKAGQHAYIVMPSVSLFPLEAHPFTIASIPGNVDGTKITGDNELLFLIHGEDGFTQRLRNHVNSAGQGSVSCYIDGPYGLPPALVTFDTIVLVAGGTGITYTLPLLLDAVRNAKLGRSVVRRIVFVWAIRNVADVKWIYAALSDALAVAPVHLVIEPRIFVTRGDTSLASVMPSEDSSSKSEDNEKGDFDPLQSPLRVESGRPDIDSLLRSEIAAGSGSRVSVDVAGPASLAAAVRSTLRSSAAGPSAVLRGGASVSLHVETFSH